MVASAAVAQTLAMALIASSDAPLLLLDDDLVLVSASESFCEAFEIDPLRTTGLDLGAIGAGEWNAPQLRSLLRATATGHAEVGLYEMDLRRPDRPDRKLMLSAKKLAYDGDLRLLLVASDVTEARLAERLKDDLMREQAIMLQELQHRVANSLQIIASVLMQSASKVQSEETRLHLRDAHSRVMSVAKVQQHLAATRLGDVELRSYFTALCASIAASMIRDPGLLAIEVTSDDSRVKGNVSVSLGLIATELVINALKHGFPGERGGTIKVGYRSDGKDWTLSVDDDGIGTPEDAASAKPGLGTGIVEALSRQLGARIETTNARPGMAVSIIHIG